jgi:DNA-binding CsgD family transcriptional regulator
MHGWERYGNRAPTEREQWLIELVAQGFKNREVAQIMGTTEHVVKNYLRIVYDKLGLGNRVELALWHEARRYEFVKSGTEKIKSDTTPQARPRAEIAES